jgi:ADP-ribose pyrophosphatase
LKIKSSQKLTELKWLNLFEIAYLDKHGRNRYWQIASRANEPKCITKKFAVPDAVVIVPLHTAENKIVVTKEYRIPLADFEYGFPAGLIDEGETIEQASRRELKEETGLDVIKFTGMSPSIYSSAGMSDESVAMVYVECDGRPLKAVNTGSEFIEVELLSPFQASRMCENAALKFDAKAWLVLSEFAKYGHL